MTFSIEFILRILDKRPRDMRGKIEGRLTRFCSGYCMGRTEKDWWSE